jgi:hypothetical protein
MGCGLPIGAATPTALTNVKRHGWPLHPKTDPPLFSSFFFLFEFEHKNMILMVWCGWRARCARARRIPRRSAQEKGTVPGTCPFCFAIIHHPPPRRLHQINMELAS